MAIPPPVRGGAGAAALAAAALALGAILPSCGGDAPDAEPAEPALGLRPGIAAGRNVVLVLVDTLRADRLPFYGCEKDTAPFLTELARRGVVFERAWSTSSWTAPATASMFTSTHPNEHGITLGLKTFNTLDEGGRAAELKRLPEHLDTIPTAMKAAGYSTWAVTANPNVGERLGFDRGFDRFVNLWFVNRRGDDYAPGERVDAPADQVTDLLREWAPELRASQPYFLYLHYLDPHGPYTRHERFVSGPPPERPLGLADLDAYDSEIRFVDEHLRALHELLSWDENTLFVFTSDHGQEFRDHGHLGHGFRLYSELVQVPLFLHLSGDGAPAGRVRRDASVLDVLPTLRALVGAQAGAGDQGRALLDDLWARPAPPRPLFAMRTRHSVDAAQRKAAVVEGRWKLIRNFDEGTDELYDVVADPAERDDLAQRHPEVVERLARSIRMQEHAATRWIHSTGEAFVPTDAEEAMLRNLGYTDGGPND